MIIPSHLQIEPINGVCTSRCTMCAFDSWTRKPYRMTMKEYVSILKKFKPYRWDNLQFLSLQGFGESLLDKDLPDKIYKAKRMGFKGVGFATNCTELDFKTGRRLLDAGLDTLICSIDGATKATHENIRVGTSWDEIVGNVLSFLIFRDLQRCDTKVIIRFIKQKSNIHEWEQFKEYWGKRIDPMRGDAVVSFLIVDCDGKVPDYAEKSDIPSPLLPLVCNQIYERMIILSNGDVTLCCGDDNGRFKIGNVHEVEDPIELYNSPTFKQYRRMMEEGRIGELPLCNTCTIPRSQILKDKV